jgi:hypothetical protein
VVNGRVFDRRCAYAFHVARISFAERGHLQASSFGLPASGFRLPGENAAPGWIVRSRARYAAACPTG